MPGNDTDTISFNVCISDIYVMGPNDGGNANGGIYYVSPDGNGTGDSRDNPAAMTVLSKLKPGDVVNFMDGVYEGDGGYNMYLEVSGTADAPITLQADEGAVPVFRGASGNTRDGFAAADGVHIEHIIFDGLWLEQWGDGGFGLDWGACTVQNEAPSHITIRHCVADMNKRNGIAAYMGENYTFEYNITSRNGYGPDSWSSNINMYGVKGDDNVVRGNVAFHGIDTSSNQSDGNGFILDLTLHQGSALFEYNIGFENGGACLSATDSGGARFEHNTCYNNVRSGTQLDEIAAVDTCRNSGQVQCGNPTGQAYTHTASYSMDDNIIVAASGKSGIYEYNACGSTANWSGSGNHISSNDGSSLFNDPNNADFTPKSGSAIDGMENAAEYIGFDNRCIKKDSTSPGGGTSFYRFGPDLDYIKSIGGIKNCFHN